jgi:hypothetical protein
MPDRSLQSLNVPSPLLWNSRCVVAGKTVGEQMWRWPASAFSQGV